MSDEVYTIPQNKCYAKFKRGFKHVKFQTWSCVNFALLCILWWRFSTIIIPVPFNSAAKIASGKICTTCSSWSERKSTTFFRKPSASRWTRSCWKSRGTTTGAIRWSGSSSHQLPHAVKAFALSTSGLRFQRKQTSSFKGRPSRFSASLLSFQILVFFLPASAKNVFSEEFDVKVLVLKIQDNVNLLGMPIYRTNTQSRRPTRNFHYILGHLMDFWHLWMKYCCLLCNFVLLLSLQFRS